MKLGIAIVKAQEDFINNKNCEICFNGTVVENSNDKINEVYLCCKGLKFPKCRWLKDGFKQK